MSQRPPNLLYIHSHDTGRYVQPYGYAVQTPNLLRLAGQGVLFRQAFCVNPTCSPSRAALLTGTWPHQNGMIGLAHRGSRLNDARQHLAGILRSAGYETALAGLQHEAVDAADLGYEWLLNQRPVPEGMVADEATAHRAVAFLEEKRERPFFLACGFFRTHRTGRAVQWHNNGESPLGDARYARPPAPLPDTPATRQDFADFAVCASRMDGCVGQVLDALEGSGQAHNTLVISTTDHGIAFPLMKCNLTDHGLGVMLILRGPGGFEGGKVIDAMVTHLDVLPTVFELAGITPPPWLAGRSLAPLAAGQVETLHEEIFAGVNYHAAYEPMRAVRTDRYKYIRRFDPRPSPVLPNCDNSVSKGELLRHGWADRPPAMEQLYDLVFDPNEACNLAGDAALATVLDEMRQRLRRWMERTNDPLLAGAVRPWPGMVTNPRGGANPSEPTVPASEETGLAPRAEPAGHS